MMPDPPKKKAPPNKKGEASEVNIRCDGCSETDERREIREICENNGTVRRH